jgi:hypothetical protein
MFQPRTGEMLPVFLLLSLLILFNATAMKSQETERKRLRIPYRVGLKWGLVDINKNIIAQPKYDSIEMNIHQPESLIRVGIKVKTNSAIDGVDGGQEEKIKWGIINGNGEEIFPVRYEQIYKWNNELFRFEMDGKQALMNLAGQEIVPLTDKEADFIVEDNLIWVRDDRHRKGELYNSGGGKIDVPLNSGEKFSLDDGLITFTGEYGPVSGYGIVDATRTKVVRLKYDSASGFRDGLALVSIWSAGGRKSKCGFIDERGREIVPLKYDECEVNGFGGDSKAVARVAIKGKFGLVNTRGLEITPLKYDYISQFSGDLAVVNIKERRGYINDEGTEIIPAESNPYTFGFEPVRNSANKAELILAQLKGRHGMLDATGRIKIPFLYDDLQLEAYNFTYFKQYGLLWAKRGGKYALIDRAGREIIPPRYDYVRTHDRIFYEKGFPFQVGTKWGVVNKEGREIIPASFDWIDERFGAGFIGAKSGGRRGLLDEEWREVVPFEFDEAAPGGEGMFIVKRAGKYGALNTKGEEVVPVKYDGVYRFVQGVAIVASGGKWGLIDKTGREIVPLKYDRIELANSPAEKETEFQARYKVLMGGKCGYIDAAGKEITPLRYDEFGNRTLHAGPSDYSWRFSSGVACVKQGDKYGLINLEGREIIPPKYDRPILFSSHYYDLTLVYLNGREGFIDKNGVEYFED